MRGGMRNEMDNDVDVERRERKEHRRVPDFAARSRVQVENAECLYKGSSPLFLFTMVSSLWSSSWSSWSSLWSSL